MIFSWEIVCLLAVCPLLCISIVYNIRFARSLLSLQESIEESLDVLDSRYNSISKILEMPVFFDSVEIRQVVSEISKSRDAILYVANILGKVDSVRGSVNNAEDI